MTTLTKTQRVNWQELTAQEEVSKAPQHGGDDEEKHQEIPLEPGAMQQQGHQWTQEGHGGHKRDYSVPTHLSEYLPIPVRSSESAYRSSNTRQA